MKIKCNKCGYVGEEKEFPVGLDFFQNRYISGCPKECGNNQSPGDASMRMFGGKRPFEYLRNNAPQGIVDQVLHKANEAS